MGHEAGMAVWLVPKVAGSLSLSRTWITQAEREGGGQAAQPSGQLPMQTGVFTSQCYRVGDSQYPIHSRVPVSDYGVLVSAVFEG